MEINDDENLKKKYDYLNIKVIVIEEQLKICMSYMKWFSLVFLLMVILELIFKIR